MIPEKKVPFTHNNQNSKHIEERILRTEREIRQVTYESRPVRITLNFSVEAIRRA